MRAQYGYGGLNRLTQVMDGPTGTPIETYSYDATGNRTSLLNAGVTAAYSYPSDSHRLASVGGLSRTYDAAGNTTRMNGNARQFVYDASGRMTQVKAGNTVLRQYQYNAKGEQTRSYLDADNTYFAYDEAGHLLGEYDANGSPKQQILWFGDLPVGVLQGAGTSQTLHYIEPDHLGTPRVIIDGQRNVPIWEWSLTGEAFGNSPPDQNPDRDGQTFTFDLRFPGQRYDAATGLNYNYFRDYDPSTGRYVQSDPIGLEGGTTTYSYVNGSPLMKVDEFGLLEHFVFYLNDKNMSTLSCECGKSYNAFSGTGHARNDPSQSQNVDNGPIPPGRYYIVKRPSGGRLGFVDTWKGKDDWFALYADDGSPNDYTATGIQLRGQFRLHPGTISKGCVTLPNKTDFEELKKRLINTKTEYIPGTKTIYYGTITVK